MKWLGSYRYATVNLSGRDREELFRRYEEVCANVAFERPRLLASSPGLARFVQQRD